MTCDEYRRKFVNENMSEEEKKAFQEHLKECEGCRKFVEDYEKLKSLIRIRLDFTPSESLKNMIVKKIKRRKLLKRAYTFATPTLAVVIIGAFLMFKPTTNTRQKFYAHLAQVGIERLNGATSTNVSSVSQTNTNANDYEYIVKIKYASDQF